MFEGNLPALGDASDNEVISTSEAAKLLFVSRPHVLKLIEEGKIPIHHVTDQNQFLRKSDVLAYKAKKIAEAKAFFESQADGMDSPDL